MTESANQKSLGEKLGEAINAHTRLTPVALDVCAKIVVSEYLRRQPQNSPVGELSEEEVLRIAKQAHDEVFPGASFYSLGLTEKAVIKAVRLASCPTFSTVYVTAERPPTEADADKEGRILAYQTNGGFWTSLHYTMLNKGNPYWMPQPPAPVPPVSAEDAQIELMAEALWMANDHENIPYKQAREYDKNIHRKMAKAALLFSK